MSRSRTREIDIAFDKTPRILYNLGWKPLDILVFVKIYNAENNFPVSARRLSSILCVSQPTMLAALERLMETGAVLRVRLSQELYDYSIDPEWLSFIIKQGRPTRNPDEEFQGE